MKCIYLPQQEARERVAAVGHARQVRACRRKRERPGWIGRRHRVQLIPARIHAGLHRMRPVHPVHRIHHLPHAGLILRVRARRNADLLIAGKRKQRQRIVECGIRRDPRNPQRSQRTLVQRNSVGCVAASRVTQPQIVQQVRRKRMCLVEDRLLSQHMSQPRVVERPSTDPETRPLPSGSGDTGCAT